MRTIFFLVLFQLWNAVRSTKDIGKLTVEEYLKDRFPINDRLEILENFSSFTELEHVVILYLRLQFYDKEHKMLDPEKSYLDVQKHNNWIERIYHKDFSKVTGLKDQRLVPGDKMYVKKYKTDSWELGCVVRTCGPREQPRVLKDTECLINLPNCISSCCATKYRYYKLPSDYEIKKKESPVVSCCIDSNFATRLEYGRMSEKEYFEKRKSGKIPGSLPWPCGNIYYKRKLPYGKDATDLEHWKDAQFIIAVYKWNDYLKSCQWIDVSLANIKPIHNFYITVKEFPADTKGLLGRATLGYDEINDKELELSIHAENLIDTMIHEMMHSAGFQHTQDRPDSAEHLDFNLSHKPMTNLRCYGRYDILSVMHYQETANGCDFNYKQIKKDEMKEWVRSDLNRGIQRFDHPFSLGDIAAIKIVYTPPPKKGQFPHHGMFHKTSTTNGNFFEGMYGTCHCWHIGEPICAGLLKFPELGTSWNHWSCCFNADEHSEACGHNPINEQWENDHSGFWHYPKTTKVDEKMLKIKSKICFFGKQPHFDVFSRKTTAPTFCGRGCTYAGNKPHWDCCHNERFDSQCTSDRKK